MDVLLGRGAFFKETLLVSGVDVITVTCLDAKGVITVN